MPLFGMMVEARVDKRRSVGSSLRETNLYKIVKVFYVSSLPLHLVEREPL